MVERAGRAAAASARTGRSACRRRSARPHRVSTLPGWRCHRPGRRVPASRTGRTRRACRGGRGGQVRVRRGRRPERESRRVGRPDQVTGVPVALGHRAHRAAGGVEDVQVGAGRSQQPGPVGLVAEPGRHGRRGGPPGPRGTILTRHGLQVNGCRERDLGAVGRPHGSAPAPGRVSMEAAFHPIDVSVVRAALFDLLADGRVNASDLDFAPLGLDTVFRRAAP